MQRVGLLVPSVNTVVEPEFWRLVPGTATVHSARMRNSTCDVDDSRQMLAHAERAADEVGSALVDVVAFACTASSFVDGRDGEAALHSLDFCGRQRTGHYDFGRGGRGFEVVG